MTALSFPTSPDTGAVYEAPNNTVYIYDGQKWNVQGTTVTAAASVNFIQDSIAPIFTNIQGTGISFTYDTETNSLSATVSGSGGSVSDFGDGFSLDNANKIVTRKLYSTNPNDSNIHYRLELTTGGTIKLPDSSEIIGSTLKGIYGTGDANYTGITIGPNSGNSENTWMWVDAYNAYISTDYDDTKKTWTFDDSGNLTLPFGGVIKNNDGTNILDGLGAGTTNANTGNWSFSNNTATTDDNIIVKAGSLSGSWASLLSHDGDNSLWVDNAGAHVTSDFSGEENYWTFARDGSTAFPNYTFPSAHGGSGQILKDNGNGTLSWGYADRLVSGEYTVSVNSTTGIVSVPRGIRFDDTTYQTTAWTGSNPIEYANIVNIPIPPDADIDGGHALAYFNIPSSADGGGSSQRFGPNSTVFNGGGAGGTYTNTLDGGGA